MNDDKKFSKFFFSNNDLVVKVLIFSEYLEADFGTKKSYAAFLAHCLNFVSIKILEFP